MLQFENILIIRIRKILIPYTYFVLSIVCMSKMNIKEKMFIRFADPGPHFTFIDRDVILDCMIKIN